MWVLLLLLLPATCSCYRILGFFPYPAPSHQNIFAPVLHALAARGHHVVFLTSYPPKLSHPNLEVRVIKDFHRQILDEMNLTRLGEASIPMKSHLISHGFLRTKDQLYGQEEAQSIIHGSERFDAVLMESYFGQEAVSALLHKFGCVAVEISTLGDSAWVNELSGSPNNPAFQIDFKSVITNNMETFWDKLSNLYAVWSTTLVSYYHLWKQQEVMDQYFNYTGWESRPSIFQLISNRSIILVNYHEALGYPQPLAPHVKNIGGVNLLPNKPLPQNIQKFMNEATDGVIYFSLGSNLKTSEIVSGDFGKSFIEVFRSLPTRVLMKWESDNRSIEIPKNVMTVKWLPQQDVLAHKNCRLFISHGGFLSLTEAVYHGVPVLGVPFFSDQPKNLRLASQAGFGISLQASNLTLQSVSWALGELLNNSRYKREAMHRSQILRDQRHTAAEEVVYWTEHAIKYPNSLQPESARLSFIQLHLLDFHFFFLAVLLAIFFVLRQVLYFCSSSKTKQKVKIS